MAEVRESRPGRHRGGSGVSRLKQFGAFWYDFVVGDDWRIAVAVVVGLGVTALVSHRTSLASWWLMPVIVLGILGFSLWNVTRRAAGAGPVRR